MRITAPPPSERIPLEEIDLYSPSLYSDGDAHVVWQTLRHEAPVFRQELADGRGFWSVTKYDDVRRVLGDHACFTSRRGVVLKMLGTDDPAGGRQMAVSDPPRHTQVRQQLYDMFTPAALRPHLPKIRAAVRQLLAPMTEEQPWDMGAAMTILPILVSGLLMGLPEEDYADLVRSGMMTVAPDDEEFQAGGSSAATLRQAHHDLFAYFADQVRERRRKPREEIASQDLIGRLMTLRIDGSRLSDGEIVSNCYSILLGANVNTGHVVSAAMLRLIDDPEQFDLWSRHNSLFRPGIREALRWTSPVVHFLRHAVKDTKIRGKKIREGEGVVAWIPSANRDEEVFEQPFRFVVGRRPNPEIAFGYGPHRCIGVAPAQVTLELTLREMFDRVARFELAGRVEHLRSNFTAGIKHLPVVAVPRGSRASSSR
jgi:cytochrome P450